MAMATLISPSFRGAYTRTWLMGMKTPARFRELAPDKV
jgi:hypothetical protein